MNYTGNAQRSLLAYKICLSIFCSGRLALSFGRALYKLSVKRMEVTKMYMEMLRRIAKTLDAILVELQKLNNR